MKKLCCVLLALCLVLSLGACGGTTVPDTTKNTETVGASDSAPETTGAVSTGNGTRTVTDVFGREITIPEKVESIVCVGSGAPRMAAYLGVVDLMVGAEDSDKEGAVILRDYSPVYHQQLKDLPSVAPGGGSGNKTAYDEQIIALKPDVILAGYNQEAAEELQSVTGIPVVSVRYLSINFIDESFYSALRIFAQVVGKEERAEELLSFIDHCKTDLSARAAKWEGEKPQVYAGAVTFSGRHGFGGTYSHFGPLMAVDAINVADDQETSHYYEADFEQVLVWDPDVIFLDPGNMDLIMEEYKANPGYFQSLRAVKEGKVYTMPSFNYASTNITYAILDAYWAGMVLCPESFSDLTMEDVAEKVLPTFLGENTFPAMKEGGLYYGTLTLGES